MCFFHFGCIHKNHNLLSCQNVCHALVYVFDNIFIRFETKFHRQIVGIPMVTNCAPLAADLFLVCYERNFMKSLSRENQADIIEAFNFTSRYLEELLNIDNIYFDQMVNRKLLQLSKALCYFVLVGFSVLLALRLPRLGKRELILVLFGHLFDLCLLGFVVSSFSWCLERAAVCDCGTPWTFLLPFWEVGAGN